MLNLLFVLRLLVFAGTFGVYHPCDYCGGYWTPKPYVIQETDIEATRAAGLTSIVFVRPAFRFETFEFLRIQGRNGKRRHVCEECLIKALDYSTRKALEK